MTTQSSSVLESLGYQVVTLDRGVYVLRNRAVPAAPPLVALLLAPYPTMRPLLQVKLFLQPVPEGVAVFEIAEHWHNLDARRFEESGLNAIPLEVGPVDEAEVSPQTFPRPDGGNRFVLTLPTGDLVCLN